MLGKIEGRRRGDNRVWDGWMASPTRWTGASSGSWWWTGKPKGWTWLSDWTELNWGTLPKEGHSNRNNWNISLSSKLLFWSTNLALLWTVVKCIISKLQQPTNGIKAKSYSGKSILLQRPCGNANEALQNLRTGGKKSNLNDQGDWTVFLWGSTTKVELGLEAVNSWGVIIRVNIDLLTIYCNRKTNEDKLESKQRISCIDNVKQKTILEKYFLTLTIVNMCLL